MIPEKDNLKEILIIPIKPFWSQMDALGHLNNAVYFTLCEQARIVWFNEIGLGDSLSGKSKTGPVVINACCNFIKPAIYPCDLFVKMYAGESGRSSFITYYEIFDQDSLYATGYSKVVWINYEIGKSLELPEIIRNLLT